MSKPERSPLMRALDVQSPVFRPLWLRAVIVAVCALWTLVEFSNNSGFWVLLFGAATVYLGYQFFVVFDADRLDADKGEDE